MTFAKLFYKSNSSIRQLYGNVLQGTFESTVGNKVIIDTGLRPSFVCSHNELNQSGKFYRILNYFKWLFEVQVGIRSSSDLSLVNPGASFVNKRSEFTTKVAQHRQTKARQSAGYRGLRSNWPLPIFEPAPNILAPNDDVRNESVSLARQSPAPIVVPSAEACTGKEFDNRFGYYSRTDEQACSAGLYASTQLQAMLGIEENVFNLGGSAVSFSYIAPKSLEKQSIRKLIWADIGKLSRTNSKNRVKGFILNSVNGGYAVAIAGYIAFLPRSLCLNKKVFLGQWRQFSIISMNPKIANIVVKEIRSNSLAPRLGAAEPRAIAIISYSKAKAPPLR